MIVDVVIDSAMTVILCKIIVHWKHFLTLLVIKILSQGPQLFVFLIEGRHL